MRATTSEEPSTSALSATQPDTFSAGPQTISVRAGNGTISGCNIPQAHMVPAENMPPSASDVALAQVQGTAPGELGPNWCQLFSDMLHFPFVFFCFGMIRMLIFFFLLCLPLCFSSLEAAGEETSHRMWGILPGSNKVLQRPSKPVRGRRLAPLERREEEKKTEVFPKSHQHAEDKTFERV